MHPSKVQIEVVTVYAASGENVDRSFKDDAYDLGKRIAEQGWTQVNGGGYTGLMGAATAGGLEANGKVDCVILGKFVDEKLSKEFGQVDTCETISERKKGLYDRGDALIALPGGLGTLDELAEVMCLRQLSFHEKPIVLVNTDGFYDDIKSFILRGIKGKFIAEGVDQVIHFADTPSDAIGFLKTCVPITISKEAVNSSELDKTEAS